MRRAIYKLAVFAAAITCLGTKAIAQSHRTCATHEHYLQQLSQHPEMAREMQRIEAFTEDFARQQDQQKTTAAIYNIPVVVHVLYNTAAQNISDAQIQSQISQLNLDYQKLNSDVSLVPSAFSSLVADCQVQFCLAQRDPSGNATTGIIRKSTTKTSFSADNDDAKSSTTGGDNAWPAGSYLNLWVVPAITSGGQPGILGYAQFPGGPAATDGVVIGYNYFGTTGTLSAPYNKGRTATHEIGHWLNLRHIWGDDNGACSGSDLVGDTPNQGAENYGCPSFPHVSCSNGPNGDMFMNYMDYTDDACMYMFSNGQKTRMHAVLATGGARATLASSLGCTPPATGTCATPAGLNATGITAAAATLNWSAASGATSYNVQWKTSAASTWNTVSNVTGTSYSLSGLASSTVYNYQVQTNCSGGTTSAYSSTASFTTAAAGCTDAYEPNESMTAAASIPVNTAVSAKISSTTDKDYFKFTNSSSAPKIKVTLSGLPADYDLKLYNSSGTLLATSQNGGTTSETITYNTTTVGTYYAYVYGYNGANSNTVCYNLLAQTSASNFREINAVSEKTTGNITLYPNPAKGEFYFDYNTDAPQDGTLSVVDQAGRVCKTIDLHLEAGHNTPRVDVSNLSAGFYFIRLVTPEMNTTTKLLLEK